MHRSDAFRTRGGTGAPGPYKFPTQSDQNVCRPDVPAAREGAPQGLLREAPRSNCGFLSGWQKSGVFRKYGRLLYNPRQTNWIKNPLPQCNVATVRIQGMHLFARNVLSASTLTPGGGRPRSLGGMQNDEESLCRIPLIQLVWRAL